MTAPTKPDVDALIVDLQVCNVGVNRVWVQDRCERAASFLRAQQAELEAARKAGKSLYDASQQLIAERNALRKGLQNIADADPREWDKDVQDQFQQWAQNRARSAIDSARAKEQKC